MNRRFFALLAVALLFLMLVSFAWVANRDPLRRRRHDRSDH